MLFSYPSAHNCVVLQQVLIGLSKCVKLSALNVLKCAENEHLFVISTKCAVSITMTCNCVSNSTTHYHAIIPNWTISEVDTNLGPAKRSSTYPDSSLPSKCTRSPGLTDRDQSTCWRGQRRFILNWYVAWNTYYVALCQHQHSITHQGGVATLILPIKVYKFTRFDYIAETKVCVGEARGGVKIQYS